MEIAHETQHNGSKPYLAYGPESSNVIYPHEKGPRDAESLGIAREFTRPESLLLVDARHLLLLAESLGFKGESEKRP